jgi:hypothetical protein
VVSEVADHVRCPSLRKLGRAKPWRLASISLRGNVGTLNDKGGF